LKCLVENVIALENEQEVTMSTNKLFKYFEIQIYHKMRNVACLIWYKCKIAMK
jgi:hypothetical protein